jgi:hypothetical protein
MATETHGIHALDFSVFRVIPWLFNRILAGAVADDCMDAGGRATQGAVADDCMDAGGRATQGAVADDCMDAGGRATQGAVAEQINPESDRLLEPDV